MLPPLHRRRLRRGLHRPARTRGRRRPTNERKPARCRWRGRYGYRPPGGNDRLSRGLLRRLLLRQRRDTHGRTLLRTLLLRCLLLWTLLLRQLLLAALTLLRRAPAWAARINHQPRYGHHPRPAARLRAAGRSDLARTLALAARLDRNNPHRPRSAGLIAQDCRFALQARCRTRSPPSSPRRVNSFLSTCAFSRAALTGLTLFGGSTFLTIAARPEPLVKNIL